MQLFFISNTKHISSSSGNSCINSPTLLAKVVVLNDLFDTKSNLDLLLFPTSKVEKILQSHTKKIDLMGCEAFWAKGLRH